jgi:hypothetical protein
VVFKASNANNIALFSPLNQILGFYALATRRTLDSSVSGLPEP